MLILTSTVNETLTTINSIIEIVKEGNFFLLIISFILATVFIGLFFLLKHYIPFYFVQKDTKSNQNRKVIKAALSQLYYPLYDYIQFQTDLFHYSPEQAEKFLIDIQEIIKKNPVYCTDVLNELLIQLHIELAKQNAKYADSLVTIRLYIMREYESLRKKLNYPSDSHLTKLNFYTSYTCKVFYCGYLLLIISLFLSLGSYFCILSENLTALHYTLFLLFLLFSIMLLIVSAVIFICSGLLKIKSMIENGKRKKNWFSKNDDIQKEDPDIDTSIMI